MAKFIGKSKDIAFISKAGAIITASSFASSPENSFQNFTVKDPMDPNSQFVEYVGQGMKAAPWGANNLKPNYLLELLAGNGINSQMIYAKVSFALGDIYAYRWGTGEDGFPKKIGVDPGPQINRFIRNRKTRDLFRARATDFFIHGNVWGQPVLNRSRTEILDWKHFDAFSCRLELMDGKSQKIQNHFVSADWRFPRFMPIGEKALKENVRSYPAFDEAQPFRFFQALHHSKMYWSGQTYYGLQPWHAGHNWLNYANKIPIWGASNINSSFSIKYHIEYPDNYFAYLDEMYDDPQKKMAAKEQVFDEIDKMLAGAENAQMTFYTPYQLDELTNKSFAGWKITAIKADLKDEAFVRAFNASQNAMTSGQWVDPALAGIQMEGRMAPSGSDKRISYQLHEILKNDEVREIMLEPLYIMRDANGWDQDLEFGFMKRNIVTLAEDKSGIDTKKIIS